MAKHQSHFFLLLSTKAKHINCSEFRCHFIFCQQGENTATLSPGTFKMKITARKL